MKQGSLLSKPFHLFLGLVYITLSLGTFILEKNDNIHNAYLFCAFILLALLGQSRHLDYKYLVGGGEKIWDKHAKKELFYCGKNFELLNSSEFYRERYQHAKNLRYDNLRRFFSYFMLVAYFLILYGTGSFSHSFLNIIPVLICFAIIKATYLGHFLIPLLISIAGVAYAHIQYELPLDIFTSSYIFLVFLFFILYRKIEQEQNLRGNDFFERQTPWSQGEKPLMLKTAFVLSLIFLLLLSVSLIILPQKWGTNTEGVKEKTQVKAQRMAKMARQYFFTPAWLKKDRSDTGAPIKEFSEEDGEQFSSGEESPREGNSLHFQKEEAREFEVSKGKAQNQKTALDLKKAESSPNESQQSEKQNQNENKGDGVDAQREGGQKGEGELKDDQAPGNAKENPSNSPGKTSDGKNENSGGNSGSSASQGESKSDEGQKQNAQAQSPGTSGEEPNSPPTPTPSPTPPPPSPLPPPPEEKDIPWKWILLGVLVAALLAYYLYKRYLSKAEVILNDSLLDELKAEWKKLKGLRMNPNQEVIVCYNFFQKVANHIVSGASSKLPPTLYAQILIEKYPRLRHPLEDFTQTFSDVFYGELSVDGEDLKRYKQDLGKIFELFHFR